MVARSPHANPAVGSAPRRTQSERSALTRGRILDAAVQLLATEGWAGTTTTAVAKLAGVSRGAQLHHFPSREDLVAAAIDTSFERLVAEFEGRLEELADDPDRNAKVLDMLWSIFRGPTFTATIEVGIAARHDERLSPIIGTSIDNVLAQVEDLWQRYLPDVVPQARPTAVALLFSVFTGMAMHQMVGASRLETQVDAIKAILLAIAQIDVTEPLIQERTNR